MSRHAFKAEKVENYFYVVLVDPESGVPHDLLFSRSQWDVAHERAMRRISILPFAEPMAFWKVWILRLLGFQFI